MPQDTIIDLMKYICNSRWTHVAGTDLYCDANGLCLTAQEWTKAILAIYQHDVYQCVLNLGERETELAKIIIKQYNSVSCWGASAIMLARFLGRRTSKTEEDFLRGKMPKVTKSRAVNCCKDLIEQYNDDLMTSPNAPANADKIVNRTKLAGLQQIFAGKTTRYLPDELVYEIIDSDLEDLIRRIFDNEDKRKWALYNTKVFYYGKGAAKREKGGLYQNEAADWFVTRMGLSVKEINPDPFTLADYVEIIIKGPAIFLMPASIIDDPEGLDAAIGTSGFSPDVFHYVLFYGLDYDTDAFYCKYVNTVPIINGQYCYRETHSERDCPADFGAIKFDTLAKWLRWSYAHDHGKSSSPFLETRMPFIVTK